MTTPDEPTRGSSTGWPSDGGTTTPRAEPPVDPVAADVTEPLPAAADPVEEPTPAAAADAPEAQPSYVDAESTPADPEPTAAEPVAEPAVEPAVEPTPHEPVAAAAAPSAELSDAEPGSIGATTPPYEPLDEAAVDEAAVAAPRRPSALRSAPVLALLLMTVLMTAATAVVWYQVHRHDQTEDARRQGLETSRDAARVLFSYDYRTLAKDFSAGEAITTGKFRNDYANTTSKVVTPVATEKKAVVKAEVVSAGVVRATPDTVVTIVYVNQVTTSSLQSGPKVDLSRVRMTVKHVGSQWLVSNVEAL